MDTPKFRQYLKRLGKSDHVVEELIHQVGGFESALRARGSELAGAQVEDIHAHLAAAEAQRRGSSREVARSIALYYQFAAMPELARAASAAREREIAKTRRAFPLREFRRLDPAHLARLEALGIVNVEQMLAAGATPQGRRELAARAGVPVEAVLEMVKLSDLSRLGGLKQVRARLYYDAGVDTPAKLAEWEPEALLHMLEEFVERSGFAGIAPLPKEVQHGVEQARQLPKVVEYGTDDPGPPA
jgi:hypothetical protein